MELPEAMIVSMFKASANVMRRAQVWMMAWTLYNVPKLYYQVTMI